MNFRHLSNPFRFLYLPVFILATIGFLQGCGISQGIKGAMEILKNPQTPPGASSTDRPLHYASNPSAYSQFPSFIRLYEGAQIDSTQFKRWLEQQLNVELEYISTISDMRGGNHYRFRQLYKGIPVEGSFYMAHTGPSGTVSSANGQLFDQISVNTSPSQTEAVALQAALQAVQGPTASYNVESLGLVLWQDSEALGQGDFVLAYKFSLVWPMAAEGWNIYIDGTTGRLLQKESTIRTHRHEIAVPDSGDHIDAGVETYYYGNQSVTSLDLGDKYFLGQLERADSIYLVLYKKDSKNNGVLDQKFIYHNHYDWHNVRGLRAKGGIDAYFGVERAYDYFEEQFGWRGIDGKNSKTRCIVNAPMQNAFYVGKDLYFGYGKTGKPLTSLDILGHEYTHGVVEFTAGLKYQGESGALNEGFADIFGVSMEMHNQLRGANWQLGELSWGSVMRSLSNPNSQQQPDTYEGKYWTKTVGCKPGEGNDQCGVHINSGVINYWYYLLVEGGKGENDNKDHYEVEKIGLEKAERIAYLTLAAFLGPHSHFYDVREASLEATRILYPTEDDCDNEVLKSVTNAWYAVGVGEPWCECFEGSFVTTVAGGKGQMKHFIKKSKSAVEVKTDEGTYIMNTSQTDPYRHVQGHPDFDEMDPGFMGRFWKQMVQGKVPVLIQPPAQPLSMKARRAMRDSMKTGNHKVIDGYNAYEYAFPDGTCYSTEEVCLTIMDVNSMLAMASPAQKDLHKLIFFGFPMEIRTNKGEVMYIRELKEHPVSDQYFAR